MNFSNNNITLNATANGAVHRIRTPHPHDVLSGRGGGINGHAGNVQFREWVRVRKTDYNLAPSKAEKARVAQEVIALVHGQNPPGRFLQKDTKGGIGNWWVELDEDRIVAKTSQALREGAPNIRAAHQQEINEMKAKVGRKSNTHHTTRRKVPKTIPNKAVFSSVTPSLKRTLEQAASPTKWPAPVSYNTTPSQDAAYQEHAMMELRSNVEQARRRNDLLENDPVIRAEKRLRMDENGNEAVLSTFSPLPAPMPLPSRQMFGNEQRQNSLALSEFSFDAGLDDFVNPFTDEKEEHDLMLNLEKPPRSVSITSFSVPSTPRPGMLMRESSNISAASNGDFAGWGSLTAPSPAIPLQETLNQRNQSGQTQVSKILELEDDNSDPFLQYLRSLERGVATR